MYEDSSKRKVASDGKQIHAISNQSKKIAEKKRHASLDISDDMFRRSKNIMYESASEPGIYSEKNCDFVTLFFWMSCASVARCRQLGYAGITRQVQQLLDF
jgi:hypothetical protein